MTQADLDELNRLIDEVWSRQLDKLVEDMLSRLSPPDEPTVVEEPR